MLLTLLALGVACSAAESATSTAVPTEAVQATPPPEPSPAPTQPPLPTDTSLPPARSSETPVEVQPTANPTETPAVTVETGPDSWYGAGAVALVVSGDYEQADLYALGPDGAIWSVLSDIGDEASVSHDGRWLGFVRWGRDGRGTLELHDAQTGESRQIIADTTSGSLAFAFHLTGRRLAYLDLGVGGESGVPWALVVTDLESGAIARYEAMMVFGDRESLPGMPIGWSGVPSAGDELIVDSFMPYTEGGWMGVWGVTLPADGASAPLDTLPMRELIPGAPVYSSQLVFAPDRQSVAFLGRDPNYSPANYFPEFYDLAVNRLGVATLNDGARTTLVEASDGSALARALAWSPAGDRLLFAQGNYEGEEFAGLSLKSSDLSGTVVEYGPLTLPPLGGLLDLAWCTQSLALYITWDGGSGMEQLLSFNLNTGISTEISTGQRLEIIGCAP